MGLKHSPEPATKKASNFEQNLRAYFGQNIQIKSYGHHVQIKHYIRENTTELNAGWSDFQMVAKSEEGLYELDELTLIVEHKNSSKEELAVGRSGLSEFLNQKWLAEQRNAKLAAAIAGKSYHITTLPTLSDARAFLKNGHGLNIPDDSKLMVKDVTFDAAPLK
jgi:hypothetical protein